MSMSFPLETKNFYEQAVFILISQSVKENSRVFQKIFKHFNGAVFSTPIVVSPATKLPVNLF